MESSFRRVSRHKVVREQAYAMIRRAVLEGLLRPGERLIETRLAELLGTSRTPVREALHKLELEGLVRRLPARGLVVSNPSREEITEIFGILRVLERYSVRLATENIGAGDLQQLEDISDQLAKSLDDENISELIELNARFHEVLNRASGSSRLFEIISTLREHLTVYRRLSMQSEQERRKATAGHERLLRAVGKRDALAAQQLVEEHNSDSLAGVLAALDDLRISHGSSTPRNGLDQR